MSVTIALKIVTNRPRFIIIPKIKNFKCFVRYFANLTVLSPHQKNPLGFWVTKPKANLNKSVHAFVQVCAHLTHGCPIEAGYTLLFRFAVREPAYGEFVLATSTK